MKKILVTGGAGFVGSNLSVRLKADRPSTQIVALDNLKRRGSELHLQRLRRAGVDFLHGDIRNPEDLAGVGRFDLMIECSAEPSVLAGYGESPEYLVNTNLKGTLNCLEVVRRHGAAIIFISTSRVYPIQALNDLDYVELDTRFEVSHDQTTPGASAIGISESFPLAGSRSLYGATKLASEIVLQEYLEVYGLPGTINRCGVITGPGQMGKVDQGFVVFWVARHIYGGDLSYLGFGGKGKQVRDILHIDDLYSLISHQLDNLDEYRGEVFNVGGGRDVSTSLAELTDLCRDVTGREISVQSIESNRQGDIRYYVSDCSKISSRTDWRPVKTPHGIVSDIAKWINEEFDALKPILS